MKFLLEEWLKESIKKGERGRKGGEQMCRPACLKFLTPGRDKKGS